MNNKPRDEIKFFRAEVFYKINSVSATYRDRDEADVIVIEYPENIKD
ncbi:MAG: hypothetical protein V3U21_06375 [Thermodesulfobacteriota bacterium]